MEQCENVILNTDVKQKDSNRAIVIAVSSHAVFDLQEDNTEGDKGKENLPLKQGPALPFIKAAQMVNEKLLEKNPEETLLFDVIIVSNNRPESHPQIINGAKHYGLDISRFCFFNDEDYSEKLQSTNVKLYLSTDQRDVGKVLEKGIPAALLFKQDVQAATDQLRVLFIGDALVSSEDSESTAKAPVKELAMLIGEMRKKFGRDHSPLCAYLLTVCSNKDVSCRAMKTLRDWGLEIDEAFFLFGGPKRIILGHIQPHILYCQGLLNPKECGWAF
ncbi:cytosolic 5'-nucleotidase 1A [Amia ocellicauda]|uniref:cytosolic 5'-nucleotidase 1A n=1 Tax=Amia ocellicauda TaxID=2972642 RepID=UPI003464CEDB